VTENNSQPGEGFTITFALSGRVVHCAADQFVLDAALQSGVRLAFGCRQGICGTCKSKLVSGQYDMRHGGGIRPREIESGMFLLCCSRPLSDLVVEK